MIGCRPRCVYQRVPCLPRVVGHKSEQGVHRGGALRRELKTGTRWRIDGLHAMSSTAPAGRTGMSMTTRVQSVSIPVADQDRALAFYTEVLGCELRTDVEVWPGARWVEVVAPGSNVSLVLLAADSEIPVAVRLGTTDAEAAHARLGGAGATLHDDEVVHLDGAPSMFHFADPDGNGLVYVQE